MTTQNQRRQAAQTAQAVMFDPLTRFELKPGKLGTRYRRHGQQYGLTAVFPVLSTLPLPIALTLGTTLTWRN